jgi:hypothetical protein
LIFRRAHFLLSEFHLFSTPARALAVETLTLKRTFSSLVNQIYALTSAEIDLMRQTAPLRTPIPPSGLPHRPAEAGLQTTG